jgi:prepilin peptidase CpaA
MTREGMMRLVALCVFLVAACGYDYKERRIPNYLILWMAITGVGWRLWNERAPGLPGYLGQAMFVMAILYPFFKIRGLGAGDVKLLGVTAGYLPAEKILVFLFCSLLVAAMISLAKIWKRDGKRRGGAVCLSGPVLVSVLLFLGGVY